MSRLAAVAATALAAACATPDIPGTMTFELAGDQLVARDWDRAAWGEPDPGVLTRVWRQ